MKRFLTLAQLCEIIGVSQSRYYDMKNPTKDWYDPELPKPVPRNVYGDGKLRFYSEDVEPYVEKKYQDAIDSAA